MPKQIYSILRERVKVSIAFYSYPCDLDVLFSCLSDGTMRQQECFSLIMSKRAPDVNETTTKGKPILIAACENGLNAEKICLMLVERGADVNAIDRVKY